MVMPDATKALATESLPAPAPQGGGSAQDVARAGEMAMETELGSAAPMAEVPLPAASVNALASTLMKAWGGLTDGQAAKPEIEPVEGNIEMLPADLFAPLLAVFTLLDQVPGAEEYAADLEVLAASPDGIDQLTHLLSNMAKDQDLLRAIANHQPPEFERVDTDEPEEASPETTTPDIEGMVTSLQR